ncbi:MAG: YggT family protein [Dehalococcoidia bacterium]|nr:YggT family protein [Dehalococcoidia bacterium]
MSVFLSFIGFLCQVLAFIIFLRAILTWFPIPPNNPIVVFLNYVTEPILAPLRRVIPRIGMVDITSLVAIILLIIIARLIHAIQ